VSAAGGRKCCACLRKWTFRGFFTKAWRFLRLSVVLGCICFCLMRFLFVILYVPSTVSH
jgi:hypothetical protein